MNSDWRAGHTKAGNQCQTLHCNKQTSVGSALHFRGTARQNERNPRREDESRTLSTVANRHDQSTMKKDAPLLRVLH
jgi:hypothetical protein